MNVTEICKPTYMEGLKRGFEAGKNVAWGEAWSLVAGAVLVVVVIEVGLISYRMKGEKDVEGKED